jgi:hypothetical protein
MDLSGYAFIRLIPFDTFKAHGSMPRYPDDAHCTISLSELSKDEYERSLIVFVSHCWLRGWSGAEGWDGRPHPDTADAGKYKLCVDGIDQVLKSMASGMEKCYLWLDFGCIDQNRNPAGELKMLDKIVQVCDCLFTPIYEKDHTQWKYPLAISNFYDDYRSLAWTGTPYSYLNRGWCRIEMFYAANIPLMEDNLGRRSRFRAGLAYHSNEGRRPHILFGSKEMADNRPPITLPPLQNSYFEQYNPVLGAVSVGKDKENIILLVKGLEPYMKKVHEGYEGNYNKDGKRHGKGKYTYASGNVYEGEWKDGKKHGNGKCKYASGNVFEGEWKEDKKHGKGKLTYASGNMYEGEWKDDVKHGKGKLTFTDGEVYYGDWKDDKKHGKGKYAFASGHTYEGEWSDDKEHGKGKYTYDNGEVYEGEWKDGSKHGNGKLTSPKGLVYQGEWKLGEVEFLVEVKSSGCKCIIS